MKPFYLYLLFLPFAFSVIIQGCRISEQARYIDHLQTAVINITAAENELSAVAEMHTTNQAAFVEMLSSMADRIKRLEASRLPSLPITPEGGWFIITNNAGPYMLPFNYWITNAWNTNQ